MRNYHALLIFIGSCLGGVIGGSFTNLLLDQAYLHAQTSGNAAPVSMEEELKSYKEKLKRQREEEAAHTQSLKFIETEGFVLRDKQGRPRATLSTRLDGSPELKFYDDQGVEVVSLDEYSLILNPTGDYESGAFLTLDSLRLSKKERSISLNLGLDKFLKNHDLPKFRYWTLRKIDELHLARNYMERFDI